MAQSRMSPETEAYNIAKQGVAAFISNIFANPSKEELLEDFEFSPEIVQSGFYQHVYSSGYGQFGGELVATVIGNYAFNNPPDLKLMQYVSAGSNGPRSLYFIRFT